MKINLGLSPGANLRLGLSHWYGVSGTTPVSTTYSISGIVRDADGVTLVSGAIVAIGINNTTSAANGTYTISGLAAGTSGNLTCSKSGYSWSSISIASMNANLSNQNFTNIWYAGGGSLNSCVIAYQPIGAVNISGSFVNLANPGTYNIVLGVAPTFNTAFGWQFVSGTNSWLNSQYIPSGVVTRSVICRMSEAIPSASELFLFGSRDLSVQFSMSYTFNNNSSFFYNGSNNFQCTGTILNGVVAISALDPYFNGVDMGGIPTGSYVQATPRPIYIGCRNNGGTANGFFYGKIQAWAEYSDRLTATQVSIITTAMQNLV